MLADVRSTLTVIDTDERQVQATPPTPGPYRSIATLDRSTTPPPSVLAPDHFSDGPRLRSCMPPTPLHLPPSINRPLHFASTSYASPLPAWPDPPGLPGGSRKRRPARSGGRRFLESPGGKRPRAPSKARVTGSLRREPHGENYMEGTTWSEPPERLRAGRWSGRVPPGRRPVNPGAARPGSAHGAALTGDSPPAQAAVGWVDPAGAGGFGCIHGNCGMASPRRVVPGVEAPTCGPAVSAAPHAFSRKASKPRPTSTACGRHVRPALCRPC